MQVGGGQHRDGSWRQLELALGLDAAADLAVPPGTTAGNYVNTASIQSAHMRSSGT